MARRTLRLAAPVNVRPRLVRQALRGLSAAGAAFILTATLPAVASLAAQPKTVAEAQAQLDQLDNQAEIASEQYNAAQAKLTQAQQAASGATAAASRAHDLVLAEQVKIGVFAAQAYTSGGISEGLAAVLNTKTPAQALDKLSILQRLSSQQSAALTAVRSADLRYRQSVTSAAQATAAAVKLSAQLAQKQAQIKAAVLHSEQVLAQLSAQQRAQLLAAQKAKAAVEQARAATTLANYKRAQAARAVSRGVTRPAIAVAPLAQPAAASRPVVASPSGGGSAIAQRALAAAMSKLGSRYVFGAGGPNTFDCSGLVQWSYRQAGVSTAHYTGSFWAAYRHVSTNELQPGDLVFFYSDQHHVGIYIGGGMMVNAPHSGDVVRVAPVFDGRQYVGAVRVVG